jgi:enoyl-CoA hydratase/carnithine racemase
MTTFASGTDQLLVELNSRVATITLNRPDARNALSPELSAGLRKAIAWAADDADVGAVVVTGAGQAFCAGGDVKAMGQRPSADTPRPTFEQQFQELTARHHGVGGALRAMRKPTIAALPGPAAGAGMAIALACDMRIAASNAFLSTGYANIGLSGDYGIAWLLSRIVNPGIARQLMLTSERITAQQALTIGLVNSVVEPDELADVVFQQASAFANGPQIAYRYIKDNLDEALEVSHASAIDREADRLLKARTTQDHKEAVQAFAAKRKPTFSGK